MSDAATGRRLGVDVGRARIGVAVSDPAGLLATPVETVRRVADETDAPDPGAIARVRELAVAHDVVEIIVGLPLSLSGASTASTDDARRFAEALAAEVLAVDAGADGIPVRLVDERMSTVVAQSHLHASGRGGSGKRGRTQRQQIDQAAAVVILQGALDQYARGSVPGERAGAGAEGVSS